MDTNKVPVSKEPLSNVIPNLVRNPEGRPWDSAFRRNDGLAARRLICSEIPGTIVLTFSRALVDNFVYQISSRRERCLYAAAGLKER